MSSNHAVIPAAASPADALTLLHAMCTRPDHEFWPDEVRLRERRPDQPSPSTSRQVADAHLVALARERGGRVVTFDGGVAELAGAPRDELVEVLRA